MTPFVTRRRLIAQAPYLFIGLMLLIGMLLAILDFWRRGLVTIGTAAVLAGVLRMFLPARHAGLLAVRGRTFDVSAYVILGLALIAISIVVPSGIPGG